MNQQFRSQCLDAIVNFETSFKEMNLSQQQYFQAYSLVSKIVSEKKLDGVAFAQSFRYFYELFSWELFPGGIVLSEQARKDFSRISDLANSTEFLKTIHSPIKIFW